MSIESAGQTLRIRPRRNQWGANSGADPGPVTIELRTRTLRSARLLGPAVLEVEGAGAGVAPGGRISNSWSRAAARSAPPASSPTRSSLGLLGAGSLDVSGSAETLRGQFQGTGNVAAASLVADSATITTNTVGSVALRVNGRAEVTAYGLGPVTIAGTPACVLSGSGAAQVRCGGNSDQGQAR